MSEIERLRFVRATAADATTLVDLEQQVENTRLYGSPLNIEGALREISRNELYLVMIDDQFVGTVAFRSKPNKTVHICNVAIHPAYRGSGIARAAMRFILEKNEDAARLELVAHPENDIALRLYTSLGFNIENRVENYFGDGEPRLRLAIEKSRAG